MASLGEQTGPAQAGIVYGILAMKNPVKAHELPLMKQKNDHHDIPDGKAHEKAYGSKETARGGPVMRVSQTP